MLMVPSVPGTCGVQRTCGDLQSLDAVLGMSNRLRAEVAPGNPDAQSWLAWPKMEGNTEQEARDCSSLGCRPPQPLIWEAFPCLDFTSLSARALTNELNSPNPSVAIRHGCLGFFLNLAWFLKFPYVHFPVRVFPLSRYHHSITILWL